MLDRLTTQKHLGASTAGGSDDSSTSQGDPCVACSPSSTKTLHSNTNARPIEDEYEIELNDNPHRRHQKNRTRKIQKKKEHQNRSNKSTTNKKGKNDQQQEEVQVAEKVHKQEPRERKPRSKPRRRAHENDSLEYYDLNIQLGDGASCVSDMSMPSDDEWFASEEGEVDSTRERFKIHASLQPLSSKRWDIPLIQKTLPTRNLAEPYFTAHGWRSASMSALREESPPQRHTMSMQLVNEVHHNRRNVINTSTTTVAKPKARTLSERLLKRAQSERILQTGRQSRNNFTSGEGMRNPTVSKKPSPQNVDVYLASPAWIDRQKAKEEWRQEFLSKDRRTSQEKRGTRPDLVSHVSELNLTTRKLVPGRLAKSQSATVLDGSTDTNCALVGTPETAPCSVGDGSPGILSTETIFHSSAETRGDYNFQLVDPVEAEQRKKVLQKELRRLRGKQSPTMMHDVA